MKPTKEEWELAKTIGKGILSLEEACNAFNRADPNGKYLTEKILKLVHNDEDYKILLNKMGEIGNRVNPDFAKNFEEMRDQAFDEGDVIE